MIDKFYELSKEEKEMVCDLIANTGFRKVEKLAMWQVGVLTDQAMTSRNDEDTNDLKKEARGIRKFLALLQTTWDEIKATQVQEIEKAAEKPTDKKPTRIFGA